MTGTEVADLIAYLDQYLESEGRTTLLAVEAASVLDRAQILRDNPDRPGLPLRNLLRKRKIPHAYQTGGKHTRWIIPHSRHATAQQRSGRPPIASRPVASESHSDSANEALRQRFRPHRIRLLLIGESAPAGGTFFYRGNSRLFEATQEAFTSVVGRAFVNPGAFLDFFQSVGFYLDDLCLIPINGLDDFQREAERLAAVSPLAARVRSAEPESIVVVMKAIQTHVARAVNEAGLTSVPLAALPFPGRPQHRVTYVANLSRILEPLLRGGPP